MQKRKLNDGSSEQQKNEARQKIIEDRKERNRISAAASRKRKDDEIISLREQVQRLTKQNAVLMNALLHIPQSPEALIEVGINPSSIPSISSPLCPPPPPSSSTTISNIITNSSNHQIDDDDILSDFNEVPFQTLNDQMISHESVSNQVSKFFSNSSKPAAESNEEPIIQDNIQNQEISSLSYNNINNGNHYQSNNQFMNKKLVIPTINDSNQSHILQKTFNISTSPKMMKTPSTTTIKHPKKKNPTVSEIEEISSSSESEDWANMFSDCCTSSDEAEDTALLFDDTEFWSFI